MERRENQSKFLKNSLTVIVHQRHERERERKEWKKKKVVSFHSATNKPRKQPLGKWHVARGWTREETIERGVESLQSRVFNRFHARLLRVTVERRAALCPIRLFPPRVTRAPKREPRWSTPRANVQIFAPGLVRAFPLTNGRGWKVRHVFCPSVRQSLGFWIGACSGDPRSCWTGFQNVCSAYLANDTLCKWTWLRVMELIFIFHFIVFYFATTNE